MCAESVGRTWQLAEETVIQQDVHALTAYGYDGVKLDGCGRYRNIERWQSAINASGRSVLIENCHWGKCDSDLVPSTNGAPGQACPKRLKDGSVHCPFHTFRTSGDIDDSEYSWLHNLETTVRFLDHDAPIAGRGCWAYPDMMQVGNLHDVSMEWQRSHFGAWCIMSAPLVLGFDLLDDALVDLLWPIIGNTEAIAINQNWGGHPGRRIRAWTPAGEERIDARPHGAYQRSTGVFWVDEPLDSMQVWVKPQPYAALAVLVLNAGKSRATYSVSLEDLSMPAHVRVRDIWLQADVGNVELAIEGSLDGHDSMFLLLSPVTPPPPPPLRPPSPSPLSPPPFELPLVPPAPPPLASSPPPPPSPLLLRSHPPLPGAWQVSQPPYPQYPATSQPYRLAVAALSDMMSPDVQAGIIGFICSCCILAVWTTASCKHGDGRVGRCRATRLPSRPGVSRRKAQKGRVALSRRMAPRQLPKLQVQQLAPMLPMNAPKNQAYQSIAINSMEAYSLDLD